MHAIFQKRGKNGQKMFKSEQRGKLFENLGKNVENVKIF